MDAPYTSGDIRRQLDRILTSSEFQRSRRMRTLLDYLVTESLNGRDDKIKAVSIAMDLYGRDESFDAQNDTIVRVEAGRLRRLLAEYYTGPGSADTIVIDVPKGAYRPSFKPNTHRQQAGEQSPTARVTSAASRDRRILYFTTLIAIATGLVVIWMLQDGRALPPGERLPAAVETPQIAETIVRPYVMVLPIVSLDDNERGHRLSSGITEALIANLAKLSGLSVMAHASVIGLDLERGDTSVPPGIGITHAFRGSLALDDANIWINLQLIDYASGRVVWADRWLTTGDKTVSLEEDLALRIAQELSVQIEPDERARLSTRHAFNHEAWVYYRQGLIMLIPPNEITRILTARTLFHRAQELDQGFSGGFAGESFSHSITVLFVRAEKPEEELAVALKLAKQAIEVDPEFGMGYATLSFAQLFSGDVELALDNARKAVEIQPGDAFAQFILGMNMIIAGRPEDSIGALQRAIRLDPIEPRTPYLNVLGIGYFTAGQYQEAVAALEDNLLRGGPRGPHMDIFLAAAYARMGRKTEARQLLENIHSSYPDFPVEGWLANWLTAAGQLNSVMDTLRTHGFSG